MKLQNIKMENVRGFTKKLINLMDTESNQPLSAVVLLGDNGCGKSTVLKAIVHCLTTFNPAYGGELFDETDIHVGKDYMNIDLEVSFNDVELKQLTSESGSKIIIEKLSVGKHTRGDKPTDYYLIHDDNESANVTEDFHEFLNVFKSPSFDGALIFYFDTFRFLPKIKIDGPNANPSPQNVKEKSLASSVLNNETVNNKFLQVKQWLVNLDFKRLKNPTYENEADFDHVINSFNMLFSPYSFSTIADNGDILFTHNSEIIEMNKLSDGFKNILIIVGEIFYRLYLSNTKHQRFYEKEAIILIDEIDCHLHPKWQINLVSYLKQLFPNCQFIVTTHSPIILTNMRECEIIRLEG